MRPLAVARAQARNYIETLVFSISFSFSFARQKNNPKSESKFVHTLNEREREHIHNEKVGSTSKHDYEQTRLQKKRTLNYEKNINIFTIC